MNLVFHSTKDQGAFKTRNWLEAHLNLDIQTVILASENVLFYIIFAIC